MVQHPKRDRNPVVSVWELASQTSMRFARPLIPFIIVFGWGMVAGKALSYRPPTKFEIIVNEATKRAQEIIKQNSQASSQGSLAADRVHHGN